MDSRLEKISEQEKVRNIKIFKDFANDIKLVVMDADGVLTDGKIYQGLDGIQIKAFNSKDGMGIRLLQKYNIILAILSGGSSEPISKRAESLGIKILKFGVEDKLDALIKLQEELKIMPRETVFLGDDINDLPVISRVRLFATPRDGHAACKEKANWIGQFEGGNGFVREFSDYLIFARGLNPHIPLKTSNAF
ncbi:HAD hydrolase family protein [Prochlorococcus sp. AH-736-A21]|nr:HAD hydrolase family protein [Prochlorococcus sp. AH-736-A21]